MSNPTLDDLWEIAWKLLHRGQSDPKSAFSTPVVATVSKLGIPRTRTLVLRRAIRESGELWCFTDRRSRKATELTNAPGYMSWTFWDRKKKIQVCAGGPATWTDTKIADERFHQLPKHSRKSYATISPPGTVVDDYSNGLPDDWAKRPTNDTDYAAENFGILTTRLETVEILHLRREGHQRMQAIRKENEGWLFNWLIP